MTIDRTETEGDRLAALVGRAPRALRFLAVGGIGLLTDVCVFTAIVASVHHPLAVRLVSLAVATLVTWRLNRALTFAPSLRAQADEAMRYAIVTAVAQGTSYAVFAALVLALPAQLPQIALLVGAAIGAAVSYQGHRQFAFAPARTGEIASQGAPRP